MIIIPNLRPKVVTNFPIGLVKFGASELHSGDFASSLGRCWVGTLIFDVVFQS